LRRRLAAILAATPLIFLSSQAQAASEKDPLGDLIVTVLGVGDIPGSPAWRLKATLYHAGAKGIRALDSLGCKVVPMRTVAIDKTVIPRRTKLFIKETVGLPMPDGTKHDGFWYATDVGGAIKGSKIDLFTGDGRKSMSPVMPLNLKTLTVVQAGAFKGCPPS
jgi:3D (Asp-Asp-Asp) domain-containing protein